MNVEKLERMSIADIRQWISKAKEIEQQKLEQEYKGKVICGFKVYKTKNSAPRKPVYYKWDARRTHQGKRHVVNLSGDPTQAEEKILDYIKKHILPIK